MGRGGRRYHAAVQRRLLRQVRAHHVERTGKSVTAIFHESENTQGVGTGNEHSDQVFVDLAFGIRAGKPHFMDAETGIYRCKFLRCSQAGVRIQSFNSLDWFIWDSEFEDCTVGRDQ